MQVVRATVDDWREVRAVRLASLADTPDAFLSTLDDEQAQPDAFWQGRLRKPGATTLLARVDGKVVGTAVVAPYGDDAGLFAVWVAPGARGAGIGEALVTRAIEIARDQDHARLVLDVGDHNTPAIRLYARLGFAPTGSTSRFPPPRAHITEHERALHL